MSFGIYAAGYAIMIADWLTPRTLCICQHIGLLWAR